MQRVLQRLFWSLAWFFFRLRYRVTLVGADALRNLRGPTLVMPNHPGFIDPPMLLSYLRVPGGLRPIVFEGMYRNPVLYPLMRLVNALEVPDLSEHSHDARQQTLAVIETMVAGLERGENFLIYPSGRAQRRGFERLGAARAAAEILARCPQANVVLVRTRGVWGSMFTYARTGAAPNLGACFLKGLGWMLANLLFFAPRRPVTMTVEVADRSQLPELTREKLNPFLEAWYNQGGPEAPTFVPYHPLFGPRQIEFPTLAVENEIDLSKIRPATIAAVQEILEEKLNRHLGDDEKRPDVQLEQLGFDSLDRMEVSMRVEDRFGFRSDRVADTVGELWALAEGQVSATTDEQPAPPAWRDFHPAPARAEVLAPTMGAAFVRRALGSLDDMAIADRVSGALSYRRLLVGTRVLGRRLGELPGEAVGVLLPASVAADIVFFALHQYGKLPVLLNWTTGPANVAHAVKTLNIQRIVTSKKLIDRLGLQAPGADFVFLEDLRGQVGKLEALRTLLATYLMPGSFLRSLAPQRPDDTAVVLFTSGSESTPKAVPLSHRNLLTNVQASLDVLKPNRADVMLGFLPPFHSFGLMGTMIAPIVGGVRVVHHPDPTDAAGLVRTTAAYGATLLVSTPTFLSYMLNAAVPDELQTAKTIVTGAEKCPDALFARMKQMAPQATIVEGYGITECSPVVAANRPENVRLGTVGHAVEGVEVCLVDPESRLPLPEPRGTGLLLVRGPSIFQGYLSYTGPDPFLEVHGHRWYITGDLVEIDDEGFIHFRGRLKRFLKAGGEMVSLPALEEPLAERFPPTEDGPQVAVEGIETPTGRWIMLFATVEINLRQANAWLTERGFRGVMRLDEVARVDSIPVLGTGKTDYKVLRAKVVQRVQEMAAASAHDVGQAPRA